MPILLAFAAGLTAWSRRSKVTYSRHPELPRPLVVVQQRLFAALLPSGLAEPPGRYDLTTLCWPGLCTSG